MTQTSTTPVLSPSRRRLYRILAPVLAWTLRLIWGTCRVARIEGGEHLDALAREGSPVIPCYWHQRHLMCAWYLLRRRSGDFNIGYLVSPSRDGELAAMVLNRLHATAIRGSPRRTGAQAMRDLYQKVARDGISPVMTPDGSNGPIYKFKPGPVMLGQLTGAPLVPMSYAACRAWTLNSWDRFMIPWPFTRVAITIGSPRRVDRTGRLDGTRALQDEMEEELNRLGQQAWRALDPTGGSSTDPATAGRR